MIEIRNPRDLIRRRDLTAGLEKLADELPVEQPAFRNAALGLLKEALAAGRAEIRLRFDGARVADAGLVCAREYSFLIDQLIRVIHDLATERVFRLANRTAGERLSVVAVGGYGRGELAPQSDIDLLFLFPYKQTAWGEQVVELMLYLLWDMGLKVGHSTRSLDDCIRLAKQDLTIRTALLESRYIWGDEELPRKLRLRFLKEVVAGTGPDFIEAKLTERDQRHQRMGDSRYVVEPNIKDGKGGLRDLHTLFWIAKYLYQNNSIADLVDEGVFTVEENRRFQSAQAFLWTVRCHLHYLAGRPEERLTFDVQRELATRMRYTDHAGTRGVERFMKHYFLIAKDVGDLTRIFCAALEQQHKRKAKFGLARFGLRKREVEGFVLDGTRLDVKDDKVFAEKPIEMLRLFHVAQARNLDIHPNALRQIRQHLRLINAKLRADPEANRLLLEMLTSEKDPETTLRRLNEAGVFGRFIPDFGRVVAQMQHDMYHVYTVDEHSIRAIGLLSRIEKGELADDHPLSHKVIHQIKSRRVLYLAVLLHDIAKGRGGDHSVLGEEVALKLCPRVGLSEQETETVAWLVRWHLAMSATAFKRDISDPKTVADFIGRVQSLERLRLLLVLTVADIRAVGPTVWNGWKGQLLRELYFQAENALSGGHATEGREARVRGAQEALRAQLPDWPPAESERYLRRHAASYWLAFDTDTHVRHARMVRQAERAGQSLTVETRSDRFRAVTEVTVFTPDHPGLFARIAGAMAIAGANILEAKIFTTGDGMALDAFSIQESDGSAFDRPDRLARLSASIERALGGEVNLRDVLAKSRGTWPKRTDVFTVAPLVLFDNEASATHTVIEVNGRDRPGLLHDLTYAMYRLSLSISSAQISTYGERAVDVFYVKDMFGLKIDQKHKLAAIERRLLQALAAPDGTAADGKAPRPKQAQRSRETATAAE
ncbi:[protein-PII] uridylyltransferase [Desertibaculum subflavum]|uniref:[protein-PII] uridylyltransferase n=1 Tax=Desertibaculum subflavum TaxID=2268458 RepID=UPI000E66E07F